MSVLEEQQGDLSTAQGESLTEIVKSFDTAGIDIQRFFVIVTSFVIVFLSETTIAFVRQS